MKKLVVLAALACVGTAFGQIWNEVGDAGALLPGQQTMGVGPLTRINGTTNGASDVDLYCIRILNPTGFGATTVGLTTMDTQLFLFDANGMGIVMNDDDPGGAGLQSTLSSAFTANITPGSIVYLAVTTYNNDPNSAGGLIWNNTPFNTERAPDGPGAGSPLSSWTAQFGQTGQYGIDLRGAGFCAVPEPGTLAVLGLGALALLRRRSKK